MKTIYVLAAAGLLLTTTPAKPEAGGVYQTGEYADLFKYLNGSSDLRDFTAFDLAILKACVQLNERPDKEDITLLNLWKHDVRRCLRKYHFMTPFREDV